MDPRQLLAQARDVMTVRQVFGEPIERDGTTVIPVAKVMGGGGGGEGGGPGASNGGSDATAGGPTGAGGGFGFRAVPAGAYVIKGGEVSWEPALDLNRVILGGQVIGLVFVLILGALLRRYLARRDG
jgi:uncharacterized spore protein YtfJ